MNQWTVEGLILIETLFPAAADKPSVATHTTDTPASLRSSEMAPVEASIEDLHFCAVGPEPSLQVDAVPVLEQKLAQKLAQELDYHKGGSYGQCDQPDFGHCQPPPWPPYNMPAASGYPQHPYLHPQPLPTPPSRPINGRWPPEVPCQESSVHSWTKADASPQSPEDSSMGRSITGGASNPRYRTQMSGGSAYPHPQHPQLERNMSWPNYPVPESDDLPYGSMRANSTPQTPSQEGGKEDVKLLIMYIYLIHSLKIM